MNPLTSARRRAAWIAVLLLLPGCGDDPLGNPPGSEGGPCYEDSTCDGALECLSGLCTRVPPCVPGATQVCDCPDGEPGTRLCAADETWGGCDCPEPTACGNGVIDPGEECDGENLAGRSCETEGFASGDLACDPSSCALDVSGCYACGPDGTPCDTGDPCLEDGSCQGDQCVGNAVDCSGTPLPDACHVASCDPQTGACEVEVGNDGAPCDASFCQVNGVCESGACVATVPNDCGIGPTPACQQVLCNEASQSCSTVPADEGVACVPTDLCQVNAACSSGLCVGAPKDCSFSPLSECNSVACNPANGSCEATPDPSKDGRLCYQSGDLCQVDKACDSGLCEGGTPVSCSHLDQGCEAGVCDPASGFCTTQTIPVGGPCASGSDQCNSGICAANGTCEPQPLPDNTPCNDFNSCSANDHCTGGICGGTVDPTCTVYLEQSFETCPAPGWTLGGDWECGVPSFVGPATTVSGSGCLGTIIDDYYSNGNTYDLAVADSPPVSLGSATEPVLAFWLWVSTESCCDGGNLKISTDNGATFSLLTTDLPYDRTIASEPAWGGDQSSLGWRQVTADLSPFAGQTIILRFAFRSDGSVVQPGLYIDDVWISEAGDLPLVITTPDPLPDASVGNAYAQTIGRAGGSTAATWSITGGTNHGWLAIDPSTGVLSGTPSGIGPVTVTVRVEEPSVPTNFAETTFHLDVVTAVYQETFEGACPTAGWTLLPAWECGTPTNVGPSAAHGGTQCLGTVLGGNYPNGLPWATATATSPAIDLTLTASPELSFWMYLHTETNFDGANLKVSTDGVTFSLVTGVTPAYGAPIVGEPAWAGNQSAAGWRHVRADLGAYAGQVVTLRFAFRSDTSVVYPGVYLDDLMITD